MDRGVAVNHVSLAGLVRFQDRPPRPNAAGITSTDQDGLGRAQRESVSDLCSLVGRISCAANAAVTTSEPRTRVQLPPPTSVGVVQQQDIGLVAAPLVAAFCRPGPESGAPHW